MTSKCSGLVDAFYNVRKGQGASGERSCWAVDKGCDPRKGETMKTKNRKAGRPQLPKGQLKQVIAIRLSDTERTEYEKHAAKVGLKLSDWIRQALQNSIS